MQKLLESELLAVVLIEDSEDKVSGSHAVVEIREKVGELTHVKASGEIILEALKHFLDLLLVVLGVLGQPQEVGLGEPGSGKMGRGNVNQNFIVGSYLDLKAAQPILLVRS